jgi:hypothetical protein
MNVTEDVLLEIIKKSSIREIKALCQSSSKIYKLCKQYKSIIYKAKCKDIKTFLQNNEDNIREFAKNNKYAFDSKSRNFIVNHLIIYDKVWVDLMYMLSNKLYDEAEALITCTKLPEPSPSLFFQKYMENMPGRLMTLLMQNFPDVLDLFGYENKEDLLSDFPLDVFKNTTLRTIIKKSLQL